MIVYDPYGELKKVVDEISAMNEAKKQSGGGKHGNR
jgi:hypothetical protein